MTEGAVLLPKEFWKVATAANFSLAASTLRLDVFFCVTTKAVASGATAMAAGEAMLVSPVTAVSSNPGLSSRLRNGGEFGSRRGGGGLPSSLRGAQIRGWGCSCSSPVLGSTSSSNLIRIVSWEWSGGLHKNGDRRYSAVPGLGAIVGLWSRNELRDGKSFRESRSRIWNRLHGSKRDNNAGNVHSNKGLRFWTMAVKAMSSSYGGAESLSGDDRESTISYDSDIEPATEPTPGPSRYKGSIQAVGVLAAILGVVILAALGLTLTTGGPTALLSIVSKSGFPAAFALIFVSEIGDKTFFIAALLAMRHSKWPVLLGASGALAVMTVISVIIGKLCQKVPAQLQTTLPVGEYAAVALLIWFGLRSIKSAWDTPSPPAGAQGQTEELGELADAEEFLKQSEKKATTPLEVLVEAFTLIFVAEWGDRSMLATIALGAAQSPWGVASGAIVRHVLATLLAVVGGALLARHLSEKLIGYFGGFLFLIFAGATLAGVF